MRRRKWEHDNPNHNVRRMTMSREYSLPGIPTACSGRERASNDHNTDDDSAWEGYAENLRGTRQRPGGFKRGTQRQLGERDSKAQLQ